MTVRRREPHWLEWFIRVMLGAIVAVALLGGLIGAWK